MINANTRTTTTEHCVCQHSSSAHTYIRRICHIPNSVTQAQAGTHTAPKQRGKVARNAHTPAATTRHGPRLAVKIPSCHTQRHGLGRTESLPSKAVAAPSCKLWIQANNTPPKANVCRHVPRRLSGLGRTHRDTPSCPTYCHDQASQIITVTQWAG